MQAALVSLEQNGPMLFSRALILGGVIFLGFWGTI
jgi:hypothetical protein